MKRLKYSILAAVAVIGLTAATQADFKLGQNVEMVVGMMRAIWLHYVDAVDADRLGKSAAAGMVTALDPYTELIHADESDNFELITTGKYGGIGSTIRQRGEWVRVAEPYEGSPAHRAGLEPGDTFVRIGDKDARGMTTAQVSAALKGEPGTDVVVTVKKLHGGAEKTITIRREVIALPAVPYWGMASDSVGYVKHTEFTDGSAEQVRSALDGLKAQGAKSLVIDLRSNGGGILQEAVNIVGMFVPRGTPVVSMRGRGEGASKNYVTENEPIELEMPLVVLVDGYSASASEIVAGALQDLDRAVIVGQRTFGKGLVQSTLPVGSGPYVKITTAKYYTPSGRCIQAVDYSQGADEEDFERHERIIPDSLITEFHTAAGRKVYDGGGVMPDVRMEAHRSSRFAFILYSKGYIDDWADDWSRKNRAREVEPGKFMLNDAEWSDFTKFMQGKDVEFTSATGRTLEQLRKAAEYERYMNPEVDAIIDRLENSLKDDTEANLTLHRAEIGRLLEESIVLRRHLGRGVTRHDMATDGELARAIAIVHDRPQYEEILTKRDTERK